KGKLPPVMPVGEHGMVKGNDQGLVQVLFDLTLQFVKEVFPVLDLTIVVDRGVFVPIDQVPLRIDGQDHDLVTDLDLFNGTALSGLEALLVSQGLPYMHFLSFQAFRPPTVPIMVSRNEDGVAR